MRRSLVLLLALAAPAAGQQTASFTIAETGQGFFRLQDAVTAAGGGTRTIVVAPGVYHDCAVQSAGSLTFRAARPGTAVFEGMACEGKAVLVLRGDRSTIDGIVFRGIRVPDGNGAGIRSEKGDLRVTNAMFLDSQEGMLGAQSGGQRITIDHSTFAGLGQCDETPGCAHAIYLANQGQVSVTHSRFERGRGGHYVKIRSPQVEITDNSFDDTAGAKTNYMIDLPDGATGLIARNSFVQGSHKENHSAMIVVAAEARNYRSAGLRVEANDARLAPGAPGDPAFVADFSHEPLTVGTNRLGAGIRKFEQR